MMHWSARRTGSEKAVTVTATTRAGLIEDLRLRLTEARGFRLATLNLDHVVKLRNSPAFLEAYLAQSHVTADGNPIVWLSRLAGQPVELLTGSDLVIPVARLAADTGTPIALLGSSDAALAGAAEALKTACPGLEVAACLAPPMGFEPQGPQADDYVAQLKASGAGLCFIALGAPKQEIFAAHAGAALPHMGFLSIGAGLDFLSGHQTRAPRLAQRFAMEWFWRLMQNPRRFAGRYAACFAILPRLLVQALRTRLAPRRGLPS